ncbi:hypothetical protein WA158_008486 [Blastocystis sp. Blastoise]
MLSRIVLQAPRLQSNVVLVGKRCIALAAKTQRIAPKSFVQSLAHSGCLEAILYPTLLCGVPMIAQLPEDPTQKNLFKRNEYATKSSNELHEELRELYGITKKKNVEEKQKSIWRRFLDFLSKVADDILSLLRLGNIIIIFSPAVITSPILALKNYRHYWYSLFTKLLTVAGPVFIKLGQWAATRPDMLPIDFCLELSRLHMNNDIVPFDRMKPVIEQELGDSIDTIFEYLDPVPIGSGCIAQVYRGKLKNDTIPNEVAVKVKYQYTDRIFFRDLAIMRLLAGIMEYIPIVNRLTPAQLADGFYYFLSRQLDLYEEAVNLERFRRNFQDDDSFVFPEPYKAYCTRNILIESYEEGIPLTEILKHPSNHEENHNLAHLGLLGFMHMMLIDNFIHGDMHPGNILVRKDVQCRNPKSISVTHTSFLASLLAPCKQSNSLFAPLRRGFATFSKNYIAPLTAPSHHPQLVILDAGLVSILEDTQKKNFIDLFLALAQGDGYQSGQLLIDRAPQPAPPVYDPEGFCSKIKVLVDENMDNGVYVLSKLKISETLARMLSYSLFHQVRLDTRFTTLFVSVMILEGVGRQLDSEMNMVEQILPIIREALPEYEQAVMKALHENPTIRRSAYACLKDKFFGNKEMRLSNEGESIQNYENVLEITF